MSSEASAASATSAYKTMIGADINKSTAISATTRYLAAAAYTDRRFRGKVIERERHKFRALAPELGIDAQIILDHCRIASRRAIFVDAALCVVFVFILSTGVVTDYIRYPNELYHIIIYHFWPLFMCWMIITGIVFFDIFRTQYITLTKIFSPGIFKQQQPIQNELPGGVGNVVVYGGFSPFVGSGFDLGGWSFTVNLDRTKSNFETNRPKSFEISELYDEVRRVFERLAIDGLSSKDRLFIDGRSIREDRRFLPSLLSRPVSDVGRELVQQYIVRSSKSVRHYLCLEIIDWEGELVLSTFIRFHKHASSLFVEVSNFILPPLSGQYYDLDKHTSARFNSKIVMWLIQACITGPILTIAALFISINNLWRLIGNIFVDRGIRRTVKADPLYNYGALSSIRELGTANNWRVYFQRLDKEMNSKIVQQQFLDVIISFLDDHHIDTSDIRDRSSYIINNGVVVSGGAINAESFAFGEGAQAKVSKSSGQQNKAVNKQE